MPEFLQSDKFAVGVKELAKKAIKRVSDYCHAERHGLVTALIVSGLGTSYIMVETSSVNAGMQAFIALFSWATFQGMFTHTWDKFLDGGGKVVRSMVGGLKRLFGRDVTPVEERMFDIAGKFHASWLANTAVVSYIFFHAGTLDSVSQALWYGFLASYDIIDPTISNKIKQGKLHEKWFKPLVRLRILTGAFFELLSFWQIPYTQLTLATLTIGGLTYLAIGHHLDEAARRANLATKSGAVKARAHCEAMLNRTRKQTKVAANDT